MILFLKWLDFPVSQAAPHPFQWSKPKIFKPYRAENQLKYPNTDYNVIQLIALQFAIHRKTITQKYDIANNGVGDIIAKSHLPNRRECSL